MFRVEYLKVSGHPQLGDLELFLSEKNELKNVAKPYTSVIIGPNGTGKSFILRTIAEIFRQFKAYSESDDKVFNLPFDLHLKYKLHYNTYEIISTRGNQKSGKKTYLFFKNRPSQIDFIDAETGEQKLTQFETINIELEFPNKILVNSIIPTDRFVWQKSHPLDFYQYLGARSTSSTSSTNTTARRTVSHLFNATSIDKTFKGRLEELLDFLGFEKSLKVHYTTRLNKLFFSGQLTIIDFKKFYEEWWDKEFKFTTRKKENPSWSIPYYNNNFKSKENEIKILVDYLNEISTNGALAHKPKSASRIIAIDLLSDEISERELTIISHLENLDIINLEGLKIQKADSLLSINDISSGEYHLIISMIGIFANIEVDSLILIDEPEISLHPNWQMKYVSFLKVLFSKYSSCHFILTTHSHFLISDLEGDNSSVTTLNRDKATNSLNAAILNDINTFGWSAEDVLYKVFEVRTTRNYYVEVDMRELLHLISERHKNRNDLQVIVSRLEKVRLSDDDPLDLILKKAQNYIDQL